MNNIQFPDHWKAPKYKLGQQVKQGQIVGVEYYPPLTKRALDGGEGWNYWVLIHEMEDYAESFREADIEPLTTFELQTIIDKRSSFIQVYQNNIAALVEQLKSEEGAV